jgi:hypothetical protein
MIQLNLLLLAAIASFDLTEEDRLGRRRRWSNLRSTSIEEGSISQIDTTGTRSVSYNEECATLVRKHHPVRRISLERATSVSRKEQKTP